MLLCLSLFFLCSLSKGNLVDWIHARLTGIIELMTLTLYIIGFLALALCVGGMVFFAIVVAPMVFIHLDEINAGKLIRAMFPWYYLFVIITAIIAAGVYAYQLNYASVGLAVTAVGALYSRQILMGKINIARDAMIIGDKNSNRLFDKLHKRSVRINALGLLTAIGAIVYVGIQH